MEIEKSMMIAAPINRVWSVLLDPKIMAGCVPGVQSVTALAPDRFRLLAQGDVRAQAARAVVQGGGNLVHLSVDQPSLDAIYNHFFRSQQAAAEESVHATA